MCSHLEHGAIQTGAMSSLRRLGSSYCISMGVFGAGFRREILCDLYWRRSGYALHLSNGSRYIGESPIIPFFTSDWPEPSGLNGRKQFIPHHFSGTTLLRSSLLTLSTAGSRQAAILGWSKCSASTPVCFTYLQFRSDKPTIFQATPNVCGQLWWIMLFLGHLHSLEEPIKVFSPWLLLTVRCRWYEIWSRWLCSLDIIQVLSRCSDLDYSLEEESDKCRVRSKLL